jgi:hypothetical protein
MPQKRTRIASLLGGMVAIAALAIALLRFPTIPSVYATHGKGDHGKPGKIDIDKNDPLIQNAATKIQEGRQTFRFDTFGDEAFWGGSLRLHQAVGQLSPAAALGLGLKIDVDALPQPLIEQLRQGKVNLNDASVTLQLLKLNAVLGVTGFFSDQGALNSVGIQCALCHSIVDDSLAPGIGHRLDGFANRDLNVGAIISSAPNLQPIAGLLGVSIDTVKTDLMSWGVGKFDAELFLDGKAFRPDGKTAATLIPPAFGLGGVTLHTWTGWGSIPHWNAFVANLEMHGKGRFWDPRLNNAAQFPIAAANGFGNLPVISPDDDRVTSTLSALQYYQLSILSPQPPGGSFDKQAAARGDELFSGKAKCNNCHVEPVWTDAGWNGHTPAEICTDTFQSDRAPDHIYRTSPIGAIFTHTKGGFYHDGRFATLMDVVNHYDTCLSLGLSQSEKNDLIEYLKSLTF